jgi:hypothetical protein
MLLLISHYFSSGADVFSGLFKLLFNLNLTSASVSETRWPWKVSWKS